MMKKRDESKNPTERELLKSCLCRKCKSYDGCEEAGGYCLPTISGSRCITSEIECLCKKCRVHRESGFRFKSYCTKNSEEQQSEMG